LTKLVFIRKFWPKQFHKIDSRSWAGSKKGTQDLPANEWRSYLGDADHPGAGALPFYNIFPIILMENFMDFLKDFQEKFLKKLTQTEFPG
jgi:hypothetical protein